MKYIFRLPHKHSLSLTGGAGKHIHKAGIYLVDDGHAVIVYSRHFWDGLKETIREVPPSAPSPIQSITTTIVDHLEEDCL